MSKITIDQEQATRNAIVGWIVGIGDLTGNVFPRRRSISSRQDFFAKLGQRVGLKTEIRFVEVELIQIEDDPTEGFDDCPVAILTYNIHVFHEFQDDRGSGSNSDFDFTDFLLRLRSLFLDERQHVAAGWHVETDPLTFPGFTQFGNDSFTDVIGHFADLTLKAAFYDS